MDKIVPKVAGVGQELTFGYVEMGLQVKGIPKNKGIIVATGNFMEDHWLQFQCLMTMILGMGLVLLYKV